MRIKSYEVWTNPSRPEFDQVLLFETLIESEAEMYVRDCRNDGMNVVCVYTMKTRCDERRWQNISYRPLK